MTTQKHLKQRVRDRMAETGERYAAARRHVAGGPDPSASGATSPSAARAIHPETAALRSALASLGAVAPHTGSPWSEEMLFGLGGGPGIGVFAFHYPAEDFSSFYIAGRHLWDDSPAFLRAAATRAGAEVTVHETGSARTGASQLVAALDAGRAAIASVDMAPLGYRGVPEQLSGGGYHVVLVRSVDAVSGTVLVEDMRTDPIEVDAATFERARGRIRSQKHRLVVVDAPPQPLPVEALEERVRAALLAAADGLEGTLDPAAGGRRGRNFSLDALATWGDRLHGDRSVEGWARMFPRGRRLWRGLVSIDEYIDHAGTGGGLLRPMYARFLREAGEGLGWAELDEVAARYEALGRDWSALAAAALPSGVPALRESAESIARREDLFLQRGPAAIDELRTIWARLAAIESSMADQFPLSDAEVDALLADLQRRVRAIEADERAAARALRAVAEQGRGAR
jgi:hypothetical protein